MDKSIKETVDGSFGNIRSADFSDLTFIIPLRIDSNERKENVDTVIKFLNRNFNAFILILEADKEQKYFPEFKFKRFCYEFVEDRDDIYRKTRWINRLIALSRTPYLAIWDTDAIAPPEQILSSLEALRNEKAVMSLPFDGRFYSGDIVTCTLFKKFLDIEVLNARIPVMRLMHGYHSPGGAYMVNKEKYVEAGGENESFVGWGPEDFEHIKRMEALELQVHRSIGPLFHLWHPKGKNSRFASEDSERINRNALLKTCRITKYNQY